MAEWCPNSKKYTRTINLGGDKHGSRVMHKCDVICPLCKGSAMVEDCPDCDGCGLKKGGVRCDTCQCYGKVPAMVAA